MDQYSQMPHISIIHVKSNCCEDRGSPRTNWQMQKILIWKLCIIHQTAKPC